jgi:hypothetical protein
MATQNIPLIEKSSHEDLDRVPHPSHRHAAPSAPWPWIDMEDGLFSFLIVVIVLMKLIAVDPEQLACEAPPIPELCDHSPEKCNRCWTGYPQSRFPNWTERQVKKAKIYDIVHHYSKSIPCICYRVDVNDHGFFTNPKETTAVYGDEDIAWDILVHEQVSCGHLGICRTLSNLFFRGHPIRD